MTRKVTRRKGVGATRLGKRASASKRGTSKPGPLRLAPQLKTQLKPRRRKRKRVAK